MGPSEERFSRCQEDSPAQLRAFDSLFLTYRESKQIFKRFNSIQDIS